MIEALRLIFSGNSGLVEIVALSLRVSGIALLFSTIVGIPLGAALGLGRFAGRRLLVALMYTGMGFPPVVIGSIRVPAALAQRAAGRAELAAHPESVHARRDDPRAVDHRLPARRRVHDGRGDGRGHGAAPAGAIAGRDGLADDPDGAAGGADRRHRRGGCRPSAASFQRWARSCWWAATSRAARGS